MSEATSSVPGAGGSDQAGAPATDWTASLDPQLRGYVANKGWKDPGGLVEGYRNLESLMGAPSDQILRLPKAGDTNAERALWTRLGAPQDPKGYDFKTPEGGNEAFTEAAAKWFHEAGTPKAQAQAILSKFNEHLAAQIQEQATAEAAAKKEAQDALKSKWGAAYEQNLSRGQKAAAEFGVTDEQLAVLEKTLGYESVMELFSNVGSRFGEDSFETPDGPRTPGFGEHLTPQQASDRLEALSKDSAWLQRFATGDAEAAQEMERLHFYKFPPTKDGAA